MKKTAALLIFIAVVAGAACDTTETRTIRIATGSSTRAGTPPDGVAYVVIAAYQGAIDSGSLVGMTTAPAGSVASLVVPANEQLEIFVACADADMVMMPYFGIGYYQPESVESDLVTVYMERRIFQFPPSNPSSPEGAEYIAPIGCFRVNWSIYYDPGYLEDGFQGESDQYLKTGLFQMIIERSFGTADNMQPIGSTFPSERSFDDDTPFLSGTPDPNDNYYYSVRLALPSMGLEAPASGAEMISTMGK